MAKDILLDDTGDLKIENGDFVIGESDLQNVELIVESFKGEFKEFPNIGFGLLKYLKSDISETEFKRDLKVELEKDNYRNPIVDLSEGFGKLKIDV